MSKDDSYDYRFNSSTFIFPGTVYKVILYVHCTVQVQVQVNNIKCLQNYIQSQIGLQGIVGIYSVVHDR